MKTKKINRVKKGAKVFYNGVCFIRGAVLGDCVVLENSKQAKRDFVTFNFIKINKNICVNVEV